MKLWNKEPIYYQIEEYLEARSRVAPIAALKDREWLTAFQKASRRASIEQITLEDILRFREAVWRRGSRYAVIDSMRAIRCFLRYFKARRYLCLSPQALADRATVVPRQKYNEDYPGYN